MQNNKRMKQHTVGSIRLYVVHCATASLFFRYRFLPVDLVGVVGEVAAAVGVLLDLAVGLLADLVEAPLVVEEQEAVGEVQYF